MSDLRWRTYSDHLRSRSATCIGRSTFSMNSAFNGCRCELLVLHSLSKISSVRCGSQVQSKVSPGPGVCREANTANSLIVSASRYFPSKSAAALKAFILIGSSRNVHNCWPYKRRGTNPTRALTTSVPNGCRSALSPNSAVWMLGLSSQSAKAGATVCNQ